MRDGGKLRPVYPTPTGRAEPPWLGVRGGCSGPKPGAVRAAMAAGAGDPFPLERAERAAQGAPPMIRRGPDRARPSDLAGFHAASQGPDQETIIERMYDLPPDVARLRTLERQLTVWLGRVREALAAAEQEEAVARRRQEQEAALRRPEGDWFLSGRPASGARIWLHAGGCWDIRAGMLPITREQAIEALAQGGVDSCPACHPARELGVVE
jgi:Family of unknown function (DUF6233)